MTKKYAFLSCKLKKWGNRGGEGAVPKSWGWEELLDSKSSGDEKGDKRAGMCQTSLGKQDRKGMVEEKHPQHTVHSTLWISRFLKA